MCPNATLDLLCQFYASKLDFRWYIPSPLMLLIKTCWLKLSYDLMSPLIMLDIISAVSWAILKMVYQFGIPNSDPQTLKSVKTSSSKNRQMTVHALPTICSFCFELLKLVSTIFIKFLFFHQMTVFQKLWKMLFISSKKLFLFSRYSIFCISVHPSFSTSWPLHWGMIEDKS